MHVTRQGANDAMTPESIKAMIDQAIQRNSTHPQEDLANDLMDQKPRTYAERQAENKRKLNNHNQDQQQLLKKQNVVQAYTVGSEEKKPYRGLNLCALSATITMMESVHPSVPTARKNQGHYRSDCLLLKNQEPLEIMDHEIKQLKRSRIPIIKVRWNTIRGPEFT
nr:putative reverse transcriptase domain-containing protein [Tanacetum cinerariifolium]